MADINANEARVNITYGQMNGDLPDPVLYEASEADILTWVQEAVRGGSVPGIDANPGADFHGFVVDRIPAKDDLPARLMVRPKTAFGA